MPPGVERISALENQIANLTQQLAHLTGMMQQQITRPNPAPAQQQGMSENALLQLLLSERDRSERMQARLLEALDPGAQIESLVALSELLPQSEKPDGDSGMLKTAVEALGSVMMGGGGLDLDFDDASDSTPPPSSGNAIHGEQKPPEPANPFSVEVDTGDGYQPPAFGNVEVGN